MKRLVYYNANIVAAPSNHYLPGLERFAQYFKIYNAGVCPVDRTGTIRFPIQTKSLFPMPAYKKMTRTYEEICNDRARDILSRAEKLDVPILVFWSGGIDSTLALISLVKMATDSARKRITVLLSEESIIENPNFFEDHVRKYLKHDSSTIFPYLLGGKHILVNGEHNDQVFGSDIVASVISTFGADVIHKPYDRALFTTFFTQKLKDEKAASFFVDLFERLRSKAPVAIESNYDQFWWVNFAVKWQTVYTRTLTYTAARKAPMITAEYLDSYYAPFFNTEEFQLWSMNNMDKKIKNAWNTYKWPCKDIIYDFTRDAEYRDNKIKRGSLHSLVVQQSPYLFIDEHFTLLNDIDLNECYEKENDFV